jgi:hypothetical protein
VQAGSRVVRSRVVRSRVVRSRVVRSRVAAVRKLAEAARAEAARAEAARAEAARSLFEPGALLVQVEPPRDLPGHREAGRRRRGAASFGTA